MGIMEDEQRHQENGRITDKTLDLSSMNLASFVISQTDLKACSKLVLNYNDLSELPADVGMVLHGLSALYLTGNQLEKLPESIGELEKLKELSVSENGLTSVPDSLGSLSNLTDLKIVGNKLQSLPEGFGALRSLKRLEIDENLLTSLPESFGLLEGLEILEAGGNLLKTLPSTFGSLRQLRILNLSNNFLVSLPASFGSLPSLLWVDLTSNKLKDLTKNFDSCWCLEKLYLTKNKLCSLPDWIGDLPKLQEISFRNNQLTFKPFPEAFSQRSQDYLTYLDLSGNFISELPTNLGLLTHLEFIHLGSVIDVLERHNFQNGNWIEKLPDNFGKLTHLREFRAEENQLGCLPENFGDLVSLEVLDLGQNMLRKLPDSFSKLKSLRVCMLSKNSIECLPDGFGNLEGLVDLRLDSNQLTKLPASFTKLINLETLDLFDNLLTQLPPVLEVLDKLKCLDLDENNFDIPAQTVPNFTKPYRYPSGKSVDSKNWRTRIRASDAVVAQQTIKIDESDSITDDSCQPTGPTSLTSGIAMALQQGTSMWQSHEGAVTRESPSSSSGAKSYYSIRYHRYPQSNEDDLLDIDDEHLDVSGPDSDTDSALVHPVEERSFTPTEDWDADLEDVSCYGYDNVYQHPVATLPKLSLDPCFAFTPSDDHTPSLASTSISADTEAGQFDDAE